MTEEISIVEAPLQGLVLSEDLNENSSGNSSKECAPQKEGNDNVETCVPSKRNEFSHYDVDSFFVNNLLRSLKVNLDTLITLQGTAREFFEVFIQEVQDIGWRRCSHARFVGLKGVDLLVELRKLEVGDKVLYKEVAMALRTLMIWIGLKFNIEEKMGNKLVITGYVLDKGGSKIFPTNFDVLVPENVDDIVPLICIANDLIGKALNIFTELLSVTSFQLSEHDALPKPIHPNYELPDFNKKK